MATKRIAFIRKTQVPLASNHVIQALKTNFPNFEVEIIDITDLIKRRKDILLINSLFITKEYGMDILLGKKRIKDCFFRTTYFFKEIRSVISRHIRQEKFAFSFQMQSLFDTSTEEIPHFIYTDHTNLANLAYTDFRQRRLYPESWIELEKTIYRNATLVFTRSSNITRSLIEQYACRPDKVVCVYAGSNAAVNHRNQGNKEYGNKNILFVGIDWERKGGPDLVEAFQQVLKVYPDAKLTIVGCSPQIEVPNTTVVGRVSLAEVSKYYEQATIFCLPTKLEPFGIVFIEALSHKLPIVATNVGAISDFVIDGENGCLVSPGDIAHLAQSLIDLVGKPEKCRTLGEKGYRLVTERYNWETVGILMKENIMTAIGERIVA